MEKSDFFERVTDVLELDDTVDETTDLTQYEEYDSLGILNLMTMFEEMGVESSPQTFENVETGADLLRVAGDKVDG